MKHLHLEPFKGGESHLKMSEIENLARLCLLIVETLPPNIDLVSNANEKDPYITDKILKSLRFLVDFQFWRLKEP